MAETPKKRRKQQKSKTTSKTTSKEESRESSGPTENEPVSSQGNSRDRLRAAIDDRVAAKSNELAQVLVDQTLAGKATFARLLVDIAGVKMLQKPPAEKPRGTSWATNWSAEQPWQGSVDPDDNVGSGGLEPEG